MTICISPFIRAQVCYQSGSIAEQAKSYFFKSPPGRDGKLSGSCIASFPHMAINLLPIIAFQLGTSVRSENLPWLCSSSTIASRVSSSLRYGLEISSRQQDSSRNPDLLILDVRYWMITTSLFTLHWMISTQYFKIQTGIASLWPDQSNMANNKPTHLAYCSIPRILNRLCRPKCNYPLFPRCSTNFWNSTFLSS